MVALLLPAIQAARESGRTSRSDTPALGPDTLAVDQSNTDPAAPFYDNSGEYLLTWIQHSASEPSRGTLEPDVPHFGSSSEVAKFVGGICCEFGQAEPEFDRTLIEAQTLAAQSDWLL
jgi:hypothetical protein